MKTHHTTPLLAALALATALSTTALAALDTLEAWGNAAGTTPEPSFSINGGTITIIGGGADFWGASDQGVFLWDSSGANTTSGDFTATARHVSTTTPAPEWGRDGIMARATQTAGTLSANDAHWLAHRKSNGQFISGRRPTAGAGTFRATDIGNAGVNFDSDTNDQAVQVGNVVTTPVFIAAARQGDRLYSGYALDLGGGVPGRWVQHWSTDNSAAIPGLQGGAEVIVGLAHQSHPQTISPNSNDINTATFDTWTYSNTFSAARFGPASSATTWQIGGTATVNAATGAVTGAAYVRQAGVATGEGVKWTLQIDKTSSFSPVFGLAGSRKDTKAVEVADLVPAANFRQGGPGSAAGLLADIYLNPNQNTRAANFAFIDANPPSGTAAVTRIHWAGVTSGTVGYPTNGAGGNRFADAVPGSFGASNQENFGIDHHGQIFIPPDATRTSMAPLGIAGEILLFKDGVDDYCYLEIDGRVLIDDNAWTGNTTVDNGGGNVSALDVSDPKYDDGEWVDFRMVTWEGGGGDNASLYWNAADPNRTFGIPQIPGIIGTFTATTGLAGSKKNPVTMDLADLVPPANFRHDSAGTFKPGIKADIYLHGNDGNFAALDDYVTNNLPDGTAILPTIHWSETGNPPYPPNDPPDGSNKFADAVPGSFTGNQETYGVNLTGQIFIPGDAARTTLSAQNGNNLVAFQDGVDDFCYLEVDGTVLISDNEWTGPTSVDNGGGAIALLDVSAPKFDDGEWVSFRMMTWEGGGGDAGALYWSALDTNGSFQRPQLPGSTSPSEFIYAGSNQMGSTSTTAVLGPPVPPGQYMVRYRVENSGVSTNTFAVVTVAGSVVPAPQVTSYTYDPTTTVLNLTFTSQAGTNYALEYTTGFLRAGAPTSAQKWNTVPGYSSIAGAATTTSITPLNTSTLVTPAGQLPDNTQSHFRIRRL